MRAVTFRPAREHFTTIILPYTAAAAIKMTHSAVGPGRLGSVLKYPSPHTIYYYILYIVYRGLQQ